MWPYEERMEENVYNLMPETKQIVNRHATAAIIATNVCSLALGILIGWVIAQ